VCRISIARSIYHHVLSEASLGALPFASLIKQLSSTKQMGMPHRSHTVSQGPEEITRVDSHPLDRCSQMNSSKIKLLLTNIASCIMQRAIAMSKIRIFLAYGLAEALPVFEPAGLGCIFFLFLFVLCSSSSGISEYISVRMTPKFRIGAFPMCAVGLRLWLQALSEI
jgi:hypothetical protein